MQQKVLHAVKYLHILVLSILLEHSLTEAFTLLFAKKMVNIILL